MSLGEAHADHRHRSAVVAALIVVAVLAVGEVTVGLLTHSLALVTDAAHLTTDLLALGLVLFAFRRQQRPASAAHTFGHLRTDILVAAGNATLLLAIAVLASFAALTRLAHPVAVEALPVLATAAVALLVNLALARQLGHAGHDQLSVRSAALHVLGDALGSGGVVLAAIVILVTGWSGADAAVSLAIALLIAMGAVSLLRETLEILGEATPRGLDADAVGAVIAGTPGVTGVHDLHIWSLDRRHRALSAHVEVADRPLGEITPLLLALEVRLCRDFGIEHVTLQPECPGCEDPAVYCDLEERHAALHVGAGL